MIKTQINTKTKLYPGSLFHTNNLPSSSFPDSKNFWILLEKRNVEKENNKDHDEDIDSFEMKLDKEALITESKNFWNQGNLRKEDY